MNRRIGREVSPLVSILMAVYNEEEFLEAALESISVQDYRLWELVIVDVIAWRRRRMVTTAPECRRLPMRACKIECRPLC